MAILGLDGKEINPVEKGVIVREYKKRNKETKEITQVQITQLAHLCAAIAVDISLKAKREMFLLRKFKGTDLGHNIDTMLHLMETFPEAIQAFLKADIAEFEAK